MLNLNRSTGMGSIALDMGPEISSSTSFSVRTANSVMDEIAQGSGKRAWLVGTLGWEDRDFWMV